jgi:formiminotetrahydrofolate cyclodeaminase
MTGDLVSRSVTAFVASVASIDEPVPAGGSVAALTGAASAALLALVCGVRRHKQPEALAGELVEAERLQHRLLALVDEDAAAFRAFLDAKRARRSEDDEALKTALGRTSQTPLEIATACAAVVELGAALEGQIHGMTLGDVRAARHLATAALTAALDLSEQNVGLLEADPPAQARMRATIASLRGGGGWGQ